MDLLQILIKRLTPTAIMPERQSDGAAGYDLHCAAGYDLHCDEQMTLYPGEQALVSTGIAMKLPKHFVGFIWPRSGLAVRNGIDTMAGVIDSDYRGEVKVLLANFGGTPIEFKPGDRIAQLVVQHHAGHLPVYTVSELDETERGEGGFGSTG